MAGFQLCRFPKALVDDPPLSPLGKGRFKGVIRLSTAVLVGATFVALTILAMWQAGCGQEDQLAEAVSRSDKSGLSAKDGIPVDDPDADPPEECMRYVEGYSPAGNDCDDYNPCTWDHCELIRGSDIGYCVHDPLLPGTACDDGNPCTEDDVCHSTLCYGDGYSCDDGNPCTQDICLGDGDCDHPPDDGATCQSDGDPCTDDICNGGACTHPPNTGNNCEDDGDPCTYDVCVEGGCTHPPRSGGSCQDDGNACTDDVCANGDCTHPEKDCGDEFIPCTSDPYCHPEIGCTRDWHCDDNDICTIDTCISHPDDCEHENVWASHNSCPSYGCSPSVDGCPALMFVNNDDDNGNGVADHEDTGPVEAENDLEMIVAYPSFSGCDSELGCYYRFWFMVLYSPFYYYEDPYMEVRASSRYYDWPPPASVSFYLSAYCPTTECGVPAVMRFYCWSIAWGARSCDAAGEPIVVAAVSSLAWERTLGDSLELDSCPNNGGVRIFPGHTGPGDSTDRNQVKLVATIEPPIGGVTVYFQVWDVDDPFDQLHGPGGADDVANVSLIDNDMAGEDNRDGAHTFSMRTATTNAYGMASITLNVSMQPGDNYRAAASCLQDAVDVQVDQVDADLLGVKVATGGQYVANGYFSGYKVPVVWSKMLTVWRKLHVETAAMERPMFPENNWSGSWSNPRVWSDGQGGEIPDRIVIDIEDLSVDNNQLEEGRIQIQGVGLDALPSFRVYASVDGPFEDTITVIISDGIDTLLGVETGDFITCDDDISDQALFDLGVIDPDGEDSYGADVTRPGLPLGTQLPFPDTDGGDGLFSPAFITLVIDNVNVAGVPFEQNLPAIFTDSYFDAFVGIRTPSCPRSTASYWTGMVGSGFQSNTSEDADPETQVTKGASPHGNGSTDAGSRTGICVVFVETIDDAGGVEEYRIIAHELAHTLGVPHVANGTGGLMETYPAGTPVFLATSLKKLREYVEP